MNGVRPSAVDEKPKQKRSDKLNVCPDFPFFSTGGDLAVAAEGGAIARALVILSIVEEQPP